MFVVRWCWEQLNDHGCFTSIRNSSGLVCGQSSSAWTTHWTWGFWQRDTTTVELDQVFSIRQRSCSYRSVIMLIVSSCDATFVPARAYLISSARTFIWLSKSTIYSLSCNIVLVFWFSCVEQFLPCLVVQDSRLCFLFLPRLGRGLQNSLQVFLRGSLYGSFLGWGCRPQSISVWPWCHTLWLSFLWTRLLGRKPRPDFFNLVELFSQIFVVFFHIHRHFCPSRWLVNYYKDHNLDSIA